MGPTRTSLAPAMVPHTMLLGWEWTRAVLSAESGWTLGQRPLARILKVDVEDGRTGWTTGVVLKCAGRKPGEERCDSTCRGFFTLVHTSQQSPAVAQKTDAQTILNAASMLRVSVWGHLIKVCVF